LGASRIAVVVRQQQPHLLVVAQHDLRQHRTDVSPGPGVEHLSNAGVRRELSEGHDRGREHRQRSAGVRGKRVGRPHPGDPVGLTADIAGALGTRHGSHKEAGVEAAGLELRRHPVRPGAQQIGAQHQPAALQHLGEGQGTVEQGQPVGFPFRSAGVGDDVGLRRPGEEDARLLEGLPHCRTHQRPSQTFVAAQRAGPPGRRRSGPGGVGQLLVARIDRPTGKDEHPRREGHRGGPSQQVGLDARRVRPGVAEQDHGGRMSWLRRHQVAAGIGPRGLQIMGRQRAGAGHPTVSY
jgi:hypothetical protein